jgi:exodeoxyribonuclease-3
VFCTEQERAFVKGLYDWGLDDLQRKFSEEQGLFTWWDYRGGAHPRNLGLRIDLMLASPAVTERCTAFEVDREERRKSTGEGAPSDHAPVLATFGSTG